MYFAPKDENKVNKKMTKEESHNIKDMKEVDNKAPSINDSFNAGEIKTEGLYD